MRNIGRFKGMVQGWIQDFHRRGANPPARGGRQYIIFTKFSEKLHEIENILVHRGARAAGCPLGSATGVLYLDTEPIQICCAVNEYTVKIKEKIVFSLFKINLNKDWGILDHL